MIVELEILGAPEENVAGKIMVVEIYNGKVFFHGLYEDEKEAVAEASIGHRIGFRVMERGKACQETKQ